MKMRAVRHLGSVLRDQGKLDEATAELRKDRDDAQPGSELAQSSARSPSSTIREVRQAAFWCLTASRNQDGGEVGCLISHRQTPCVHTPGYTISRLPRLEEHKTRRVDYPGFTPADTRRLRAGRYDGAAPAAQERCLAPVQVTAPRAANSAPAQTVAGPSLPYRAAVRLKTNNQVSHREVTSQSPRSCR
jgi:hypothetical protein